MQITHSTRAGRPGGEASQVPFTIQQCSATDRARSLLPGAEDQANLGTRAPSPGTDLRIFEDRSRTDETRSRLKCEKHFFPVLCNTPGWTRTSDPGIRNPPIRFGRLPNPFRFRETAKAAASDPIQKTPRGRRHITVCITRAAAAISDADRAATAIPDHEGANVFANMTGVVDRPKTLRRQIPAAASGVASRLRHSVATRPPLRQGILSACDDSPCPCRTADYGYRRRHASRPR